MSIARVKQSAFAARKGATLSCHRCRREIAKGEVYLWWFKGFRSRFKHVRCTACPRPRSSELESSNLAEAYAAQETAEDALDAMGEPGDSSDIDQVVGDMASSIEEVASTYREADEAFGGSGATVSGEMADNLEQAQSDLEQFQAEEFDEDPRWCELHDGDGVEADAAREEPCEDCDRIQAEQKQTWWDGQVEAARDAVSSASF